MKSTSHQPLINLLNQLKASAIQLPDVIDAHTKEMLSKLNPDDAKNYEQIVKDVQAHIKTGENININDIVAGVKNSVSEINKNRKR